MKILISGSSGLVGTALTLFLQAKGHELLSLTRSKNRESSIYWKPEEGLLDPEILNTVDAVIHLAGENLANKRWSPAQKRKILDSRVMGTQLLAETIANAEKPPKIWISASAVGFYGNSGDQFVDENSPAGTGFLADVCKRWEAATQKAENASARVVHLRTGMVLSSEGGALKKMLPPFRMGVGGQIGDGRQYISWILLEDMVHAIDHILNHDSLSGAVNLVTPEPVTNQQFTKTLGAVLHRPTLFPLPAFMAKILFGEMANELLLSGTRALPTKLLESGYSFLYPKLTEGVEHLLAR